MADQARKASVARAVNGVLSRRADGAPASENSILSSRLLTVCATAALLGCSRANVYALIEAGDLPVVTIGRSRGYRIDRQDIEAFIDQRKVRKARTKTPHPASRPRLKHIKL